MKRSYLVLHIAVLLAGFTGVFGKLIDLSEFVLVWYRVLFSAIILYVACNLFRVKPLSSVKEAVRVGRVGLFLAIHWIFFYASIQYANISVGVICYCLTSFFTAIFDPIINKRRFNPLQLVLTGITLLGISLIFHFDATYQWGILMGIISSAFAALYTVYNEKLVQHYDSRLINYYQMLMATVGLTLLLPFYCLLFPGSNLVPTLPDVGYLFCLAFFCTVILYILFAESLKKLSAFTVNLSFNLEPIYAIIVAFLWFKEGKELNFLFYLGLSFVLLSVALQTVISFLKKA